jgi:hypothetical protein
MTTTEDRLNAYEEKLAARLARMRAYKSRAERESEALSNRAREMSSVIPLGQPILIGHHSEKADRRYRNRIHGTYRRAHELHQRAAEIRARIEAAENNRAIFSDNPRAGQLIQEKIEQLEAQQILMKEANKRVRANDREGLAALGFSDEQIERMLSGSRWDRGFPAYRLSNNSAEIRRLKQRAAQLEKTQAMPDVDEQIGSVRLLASADTNRVQLQYPRKPSDAHRAELKSNGFKWSPTASAWQRHLSPYAIQLGRQMAAKFEQEPK